MSCLHCDLEASPEVRIDYKVLITRSFTCSMYATTFWFVDNFEPLCFLFRSNFHRNSLERVPVPVPVLPINAFTESRVSATEVQAVRVTEMTAPIPPGSLEPLCTVTTALVIVPIQCRELHASLIRERISWKNHKFTISIFCEIIAIWLSQLDISILTLLLDCFSYAQVYKQNYLWL